SCAWYLRERIIILPYSGCFTRRSTSTKTVLSILLLTTRPRNARCRFSSTGVVCVSVVLTSYLLSLFLSHDGTAARDITAYLLHIAGVGKLLGCTLHTRIILCLEQALELFFELFLGFVTQFTGFHDDLLSPYYV